MSEIKVVPYRHVFEKEMILFLKQHEETSLLLLDNFIAHGPTLTDATFSANYKLMMHDGKIIGVIALTKIGNLLAQTDYQQDYSDIILKACEEGSIQIKGLVGDWSIVKPLWTIVKHHQPDLRIATYKKEILYRLSLNDSHNIRADSSIRLLTPHDYAEWGQLYHAYLLETHLDLHESESAMHKRFIEECHREHEFGLFEEGQMVAICSYISDVNHTGQVGGVYTVPEFRNQGYAKRIVSQLIRHAKEVKQMKKLILFADESNPSALKVYQQLGFTSIGYFGLIFWGI